MSYERPGLTTVLVEEAYKYLVQWALVMQKQGLLVGWDIIIQKDQEIHCLINITTSSVGSVGLE